MTDRQFVERMQRLRGQLVAVVIAHFVLVYLLLA